MPRTTGVNVDSASFWRLVCACAFVLHGMYISKVMFKFDSDF